MYIYLTSICCYFTFSYLLYRLHIYIKSVAGTLPKGCLPFIDIGYPTAIVYLVMLAFKMNWWVPFLVFAIGGFITVMIDRFIHPKISLTIINLGIPLFAFLMFYYLLKKP